MNLSLWQSMLLRDSQLVTTDFQGGFYDSRNSLNMKPLILNTVHFLAGTSCLCRPMMDQAIDQIDDTIEQVRENLGLLRHANLDEFEMSIRRALLIMYGEPDQWRIRALRIVMGKLMAVCFPLILQSQRWKICEELWGILRVRIVADHKWLYEAGMCPRNDVILSGFENLNVTWVRYREEGWQPCDDLMFPPQEVGCPPAPPASAPPTPAGGKKKSKAIPIVKPSDSCSTSASAIAASGSTNAITKNRFGETSKITQSFAAKPTTATTADASSPAVIQSVPISEDPFIASTPQPHPSLPPPFFTCLTPKMATSLPVSPQRTQGAPSASRMAKKPAPILPCLPDGPFYFAETSTGEPASKFASRAAFSAPSSVARGLFAYHPGDFSISDGFSFFTASATPSLCEEASSASGSISSMDPLDSPSRRLAELKLAFDSPDDKFLEELATPRAPTGNLRIACEKSEDIPKEDATPRAFDFGHTKLSQYPCERVNTPTSNQATHSQSEANEERWKNLEMSFCRRHRPQNE